MLARQTFQQLSYLLGLCFTSLKGWWGQEFETRTQYLLSLAGLELAMWIMLTSNSEIGLHLSLKYFKLKMCTTMPGLYFKKSYYYIIIIQNGRFHYYISYIFIIYFCHIHCYCLIFYQKMRNA